MMMSETSEPAETETDVCSMYSFTRDDIDAVNPINWYDTFKSISPTTVICPIPPEVLKYLKTESVMMPQDTHTTAHGLASASSTAGAVGGSNGDEDNISWASISSNEVDPAIPSEFLQKIRRDQKRRPSGRRNDNQGCVEDCHEEEWGRQSDGSSSSEDEDDDPIGLGRKKLEEVGKFHEYDSMLDANIKELGGAVLPKINRKAPKDAAWIGFNRSLKCYNVGDIYLLLKTSDIISQVLDNPYKECLVDDDPRGLNRRGASSTGRTGTSPYLLILKQWDDSWGPEMEFRCFICANQLIAICQRDLDTCHSSIIKRKDKLLLNIQNFFIQNVQGRFSLDFYVMDILCHPKGDIYIVDFDVFGLVTDPLLFTYRELRSIYEKMDDELNTEQLPPSWDDNKVADYLCSEEAARDAKNDPEFRRFGSPCLRFLTESRRFRGRKTGNHSALANDVMTYIRESVANK